ncbi:DUF4097 and DUF4098 domain-containing protein YvlB [Halobacillus alkaliphilus]|uniref:DUF4097 and DUF4098 domain-containing protein YvlB n=1 Tax=Halobacillus alkaliphilus TaxID=396056 RepID=A0A1I2N3I5_9BACI|nr:DUF4097 family beta strand repeat-containing protein [Halobacillus alkaliphilus]SFF96277.1 DUF4097 and DUF4098 domain-containing protein YvlB [Halobacillus alkaliphilus]
MKKAVWIVVFALILGGGTLISVQATKSLKVEKRQVHKEEAFTASDIREVHVNTSSADVQFIKGESDEIQVTLSGYARKWKQYSYEAKETNGELKIKLEKNHGLGLSFGFIRGDDLKLLVEVPEQKLESVKINTSSSEVSLRDLQVSHLIASSSSGDIEVSNLQMEEKLNIHSSSGDVMMTDIKGPDAVVELATSSGDIEGYGLLVNEMKADSSSGKVDISHKRLAGNLTATTSSGDVTFSFEEEPPSFMLSYQSSSGEERIQLDGIDYERRSDHEVKGYKGDQKYQIVVETSSGNFTLD